MAMVAKKAVGKKKGGRGKATSRPLRGMPAVSIANRKRPSKARSEAGSRDMAQIIVDPCSGDVNVDMYPGPRASSSIRFKSRWAWSGSSSGNDTAFAFAYHPAEGVLRWQNEAGYTTAVTESSNGLWYRHDTVAPGNNVLNNLTNVASRRGKAGCAGISWSGTELNRQGTVHMDVVNGGQIFQYLVATAGGAGTPNTIGFMLGGLGHSERTPRSITEITWMPGEGDKFMQGAGSASSTDYAEKDKYNYQNWLVVIGTGFAAGTVNSVIATLVSVVDANWVINSGIPNVQANVASPRQMVSDVLARLRKKDTMWYINSARKVGTLLAGLL